MTNAAENILSAPTAGAAPGTEASNALFAAHPVASVIFTRSGKISAVNNAARLLFRCDAASLIGRPMSEFFPEQGNSLREVRTPVEHRRVAVRRADGSNLIARLQLVPLGEFGENASLLASIEDLTDHEHEISESNRELESFTSAAGHDLRGPLRILKGFTEALEDECGETLNGEGKTFLKEIIKASDRMEGLIDGMLTMSRAGRAEMICESLDLSTLVDLVYYELRHAETERGVECSVDPGIMAWGDVRLMMTVLRNLLGNAWKFTSRTAGASIHFYTEERDGRTWYCVRDNGAGFDMSHAERLFKPFTRLHRQDEFPGHGLGLATVQRIVKRHGGDIAAEATPNQGATVRFSLGARPSDR